jgi:hypothetical protein
MLIRLVTGAINTLTATLENHNRYSNTIKLTLLHDHQMRVCLVTGATGFVGLNLVDALLERSELR